MPKKAASKPAASKAASKKTTRKKAASKASAKPAAPPPPVTVPDPEPDDVTPDPVVENVGEGEGVELAPASRKWEGEEPATIHDVTHIVQFMLQDGLEKQGKNREFTKNYPEGHPYHRLRDIQSAVDPLVSDLGGTVWFEESVGPAPNHIQIVKLKGKMFGRSDIYTLQESVAIGGDEYAVSSSITKIKRRQLINQFRIKEADFDDDGAGSVHGAEAMGHEIRKVEAPPPPETRKVQAPPPPQTTPAPPPPEQAPPPPPAAEAPPPPAPRKVQANTVGLQEIQDSLNAFVGKAGDAAIEIGRKHKFVREDGQGLDAVLFRALSPDAQQVAGDEMNDLVSAINQQEQA